MRSFIRWMYLIVFLTTFTQGIAADTIEGFAFLSDSSNAEEITVTLVRNSWFPPPAPVPAMTAGGLILLLLVLTFMIRRKPKLICLLLCMSGMIGALVVYASRHTWVYTTSADGYYCFVTPFDSLRYYMTFTKESYRPGTQGPFQVDETMSYFVADTTLYPFDAPFPTRTPKPTSTSLPTIPATHTPYPTPLPGSPTYTPSPYPTCTPTPTRTPYPTWPECGPHPTYCDQVECNFDAYSFYHTEYLFVGGSLYAGWDLNHDYFCPIPCRFFFPQAGGWPDGIFTVQSDCYPPTPFGSFGSGYYLDPDLNCDSSSIAFTGVGQLGLSIPMCQGDWVIFYESAEAVVPIITPSIVSDEDITGEPLEFLTFDSEGIARIRLRLNPDPCASTIYPLKLVIYAGGQIFEKEIPLLFSQENMVFSDVICVYRSLSSDIPELPCDCLVLPNIVEYAAIKVSGLHECSIAPAITVDFLAEVTPTPGLQPNDRLKVSKWENAFGVTFDPTPGTPTPALTPQFIETDPYRFKIRVADHASQASGTPGVLTISSRIWNNETPLPIDEETEMFLYPQGTPGVWITDHMILVSDDVDDDYPFFGVDDDMPNDRTHRVTIDSEVVARYRPATADPTSTPTLTGRLTMPETMLTTPTPLVIEQIATMEYETFRFFPVIFEVDREGTQTPVIDPAWVEANIQDIKNIYASVGVKIEPYPIQIITPISGIDVDDGVTYPSAELNILLDSIGPINDPSDFYLVFIGELSMVTPTPLETPNTVKLIPSESFFNEYLDLTATPTPWPTPTVPILGLAFYNSECSSTIHPRSNNCLLNSPQIINWLAYTTTSHEIGHCLTRYGHFLGLVNLMQNRGDGYRLHTSIYTRKRFSDIPLPTPICQNTVTPTPKNQEDRIHEHDQVN